MPPLALGKLRENLRLLGENQQQESLLLTASSTAGRTPRESPRVATAAQPGCHSARSAASQGSAAFPFAARSGNAAAPHQQQQQQQPLSARGKRSCSDANAVQHGTSIGNMSSIDGGDEDDSRSAGRSAPPSDLDEIVL
jgi:hypothetical protein